MWYQFVNCTPHEIRLNSGRCFSPSGHVARVESKFETLESIQGGVEDIPAYRVAYGEITGLPDPVFQTLYIVSAMVLEANNRLAVPRHDLVAPSTGHPSTVRNEGHIVSVGGFVR
jgi:hypothetical protein